ncbi:MAG TPA: HNH endonuclease [Thermoanaerobaculia bacterium]|jgi:hypothetical protein|nr:HNH endonuclease [Thermoanaerobaculia bacterium]
MVDGTAELRRRLAIWAEIKARGGPDYVEPQLIKQLRVHRGEQGIYRDNETTTALAPPGVTVGVLHTGTTYADDLSADGVIYHYPKTARPGAHDANEIAATKACREFGLPLFVVITPPDNPKRRNVRLGWVQDYDDEHGLVLILFSDVQQPPVPLPPVEETVLEDFALKVSRRSRRQAQVTARPNQTAFRFNLMKLYGVGCAVCDIQCQELLHAAHICPVEENGSDHPLNGIVFCLNHHRAFDAGLFQIDPETLEVKIKRHYSAQGLGLTRTSIRHLRQAPHPEALRWVWSKRGKGLEE